MEGAGHDLISEFKMTLISGIRFSARVVCEEE
jgi:hypothetical protein